ncbi:hypothetical protein [Rhodococcus sp. BUPNP1]|uniref:hypothetical protein n=1 Tax=Rhodococcus sp. BUPNP1 TaxID=1432786 RepID=UPI000B5AA8C1|nr:hypothetical protein [Rhodococcus sp. BUPNP1]OWY80803.1 hypothetical protein B9C99_15775 [Rhodococcus sp. BUPNP1]
MLQKRESNRFASALKTLRSLDDALATRPGNDSHGGAPAPASDTAPAELRNATPSRLHITHADGRTLVFAPLERRVPTDPERQWPWEGLIRHGYVVPLHATTDTPLDGTKARSRRQLHTVTLWCMLVISVAVPISAFATGLVSITAAPVVAVAFVAVATMLPGLLFFLFDRQRLSTLRDRFEWQIFRLDPNVHTLADVQAKYGGQMDEVFYAADERTTTVNATQRLWPILVSTVTIALGWTMALYSPAASSGTPDTSLFTALADPLAFAFLGAYFFSLNTCLRRYSRNDLRPKAYSAITVRVITVVILACLLQAVVESPESRVYDATVLPLAFVIGVLPETAMVLLRDTLRRFALTKKRRMLEEQLPLTDIEGLDLYDRARLIDEGVPNVEALAHHDLVDLLLETRIPVGRLVDWVDQAILRLHIVDSTAETDPEGARVLSDLRALGIRSATDLLAARQRCAHRKALVEAVARGNESPADAENRLELLVTALCDDEWITYIRTWRDRTLVSDRYIRLDRNGEPASVRTEVPDNDLHDCRRPNSRISSLYRRFTPPYRIETIL